MLRFFHKVTPIKLGRWGSKKPMTKVDFANSDHCGTCEYLPQNEIGRIKISIPQIVHEKIFCEACGGRGYCMNIRHERTICSSCMGSGVQGYTYF
jgi:DnaJ-class molecular chaperone